MPELSPETQKIVNAAVDVTGYGKETPLLKLRIAAALRVVAEQCKIEWNHHPDYPETESVIVVSDLLTIADELEQS